MPLATDVTLPKSQAATFPDRCVACGQTQPGGSIGIWTEVLNLRRVLNGRFGWPFRVKVPVCDGCRNPMHRQIWTRFLLRWGGAIVGFAVAWYLLEGFDRGSGKQWYALGVILLFSVPIGLWDMFFPKPINLIAFSGSVHYEFRDATYAAEFAELNGGAIDEDDG